jgi:uncharacterized spore protein YtfJ
MKFVLYFMGVNIQRPEQVLEIEVRFLADGRGHVAGLAVELVEGDHLPLGHVVGQGFAARVTIFERQDPFFPLGGGFAGGWVDEHGILVVAVVVLEQLDIDVIRAARLGRVIGEHRAGPAPKGHPPPGPGYARRFACEETPCGRTCVPRARRPWLLRWPSERLRQGRRSGLAALHRCRCPVQWLG